jgi:cysteine desulfurase/selenocysteine lyase
MDAIRDHEIALTRYAWNQMLEIPELKIYGPEPDDRCGVIAFNIAGVHPHDTGSILDEGGVCVRAGHHCAQPLHARLAIDASTRASFYIYNTEEDVDQLVDGLHRVRSIFGVGA